MYWVLTYIVKRVLYAIPLLFIISIVSFIIIELPPGDYLTTYVMTLRQSGETIDQAALEVLKKRYGLDKPVIVRYFYWIGGILRGDFGYSFMWEKPVSELLNQRVWWTILISILSTAFAWVFGFLIGVYSGTHQYSMGDYIFTVLGYIGLATPNFLLALILLWVVFVTTGVSLGGLFSAEFAHAPWSWAKFVDLLKHIWIPVVVIGTGSMAGLIRVLRANLLDEINKPYVVAARARGVPERELVWKYPLRVAVIPFASTAGWALPQIVSGAVVTGIVLNLPTVGTLLLDALTSQDMYLAGSLVLILSVFTIIGTLISDILLAWLDPRIRFE
ncbi:Binding-protein-dependent transport systems inner membrane component [Thermotoga neapolitana DSM 4359]|uniref:Binding-protein-dependent transport systems inner membrane component n=1 Tax=Thermotoga neapolitana (strain ATCC 49049 / DSM 4359 / NBRC 107923 / NS-E) TaxID=309803 RepID=B9K777_THENN|nr:Binding-protein-dependent transport systems inner membrane component [Thermotoga neapolitana DSM 4359]